MSYDSAGTHGEVDKLDNFVPFLYSRGSHMVIKTGEDKNLSLLYDQSDHRGKNNDHSRDKAWAVYKIVYSDKLFCKIGSDHKPSWDFCQ